MARNFHHIFFGKGVRRTENVDNHFIKDFISFENIAVMRSVALAAVIFLEKIFCVMAIASAPEMRIMPSAPCPCGVQIAVMVLDKTS